MTYRNSIISNEWYHTVEAETVLQTLYDTNGHRRQFGILERPALYSSIEEISYKLWFIGKAGVGKTTAINRLAGETSLSQNYIETSGIRKTCIYWPAKIWDKIFLFKLNCWECGEISGKKYSHIMPACRDKADIIVVIFSFVDPASLREAQNILTSIGDGPAKIVLGVRYNPYKPTAVKISDVQELANICQVEVATLEEAGIHEGISEMPRIAPVLNVICQTLWKRDQQFVLIQSKPIQV